MLTSPGTWTSRWSPEPTTAPIATASIPSSRNSSALTMMEAGYKINIIPERAEMSLDCRLLPDTDEHQFIERLERLVDDPAIEFEVGWPNAPAAALAPPVPAAGRNESRSAARVARPGSETGRHCSPDETPRFAGNGVFAVFLGVITPKTA